MIFFNGQTVLAVACGMTFGYAAYSLFKSQGWGVVVGVLAVIADDLFTRLSDPEEEPALLHPNAGAHVPFIPAWIAGIVGPLIGVGFCIGWL